MQTDMIERVLEDLVETLEDGKKGFARSADKLAETGRNDLAERMRELSGQRERFSSELRALATSQGVEVDTDGSMTASMHRSWLSLKESLASNEVGAVLAAAETGEDHATREYRKALDEDLPAPVRSVVAQQAEAVERAHDEVRRLRDREQG